MTLCVRLFAHSRLAAGEWDLLAACSLVSEEAADSSTAR
jgi:hypothetical protein